MRRWGLHLDIVTDLENTGGRRIIDPRNSLRAGYRVSHAGFGLTRSDLDGFQLGERRPKPGL